MAQVTITINGRTYRLECGDGEEAHLLGLSDRISRLVDEMRAKFGQIGDDRLLLMAGLTIADELSEARRLIADLEAEVAERRKFPGMSLGVDNADHPEIADQIDAVADRIEALSQQLARTGAAPAPGKREPG